MAKQPEDDRTLDLPLPKRRGRPAKYSSAAERQKAFRKRRKAAGGGDSRQTTISSLRNEIAQLKAVLAAEQAAHKEHSAPPAAVRELEWEIRSLKAERDIFKFRKSDRLRELLAKRLVMPKRDLSSVFLVDFLGKPIERDHQFDRATKEALEFGRKAALAVNTISETIRTLDRRQQISADETAVLDAAAGILEDIHRKSTRIKEHAKASSAQIKRAEAERRKFATAAVAKAFPDLTRQAVHLTLFLEDHGNYSLTKLRQMRPETVSPRDLHYHLDRLAEDSRSALIRRVEEAIDAGENADEAAGKIHATFTAATEKIETDNSREIENITTCLVAAQLVAANPKR